MTRPPARLRPPPPRCPPRHATARARRRPVRSTACESVVETLEHPKVHPGLDSHLISARITSVESDLSGHEAAQFSSSEVAYACITATMITYHWVSSSEVLHDWFSISHNF